jgi:hypothetical protein
MDIFLDDMDAFPGNIDAHIIVRGTRFRDKDAGIGMKEACLPRAAASQHIRAGIFPAFPGPSSDSVVPGQAFAPVVPIAEWPDPV